MKMITSDRHEAKHYALLLTVFIICLMVLAPANAQNNWEPTNGPYGGSIYAITTTPNGMIYAGAGYGGVFKSSDKGLNWQNAGLVGTVYSLFALSDSVIFAGTHSVYFYRTRDAGNTWQLKNNGLPAFSVTSMAYIQSKNYLFAATSNGIYRTDDQGENWVSMNANLPDLSVNGLLATTGGALFCGSQSGLYVSTDYGDNWAPVTQGLPSTSVLVLTSDAQGNLFAGLGSNYGVYMSTNGGSGWSPAGLSGKAIRSLAISPDGIWYAGTWRTGLYVSSDMGSSWDAANLGSSPLSIQSLHVDQQSKEVYAGGIWSQGSGIYFSDDAGKNWESRNQGLAGIRVWRIAMNPSTGSLYAGGYYNGLFRSQNQGGSWEPIGEGMPENQSTFIRALAVHPSGTVFCGSGGGGLYRSRDDGNTWERIYGEPGYYVFVGAVAVRQDGIVFVGESANGGISRSGNEGDTWEDISNNLPDTTITCIAFNSDLDIYVGTGKDGVYRSTDDGKTWSAVGSDLRGLEVNDMAIDSQNRVFVTVNGQGVLVTDNNSDWLRVGETVLGSTNRPVAVNQADYIFTGLQNLWISKDRGSSWTLFDRGLETNEINDLDFDLENYLWAATYNGVFKTINSTTAVNIGFRVKMRYQDGFDNASQGVVVRGPFNNWGSDGDWDLVAEDDADLTYSGSFALNNALDFLRNDTLEYIYAVKAGDGEWLPAPRTVLWDGTKDLQLEPVWFGNQREFTRMTTSGLITESTDSRGVAWADIDNDLDDDLIITDTGTSARNDLFINNGAGLFSKVTSGPLAADVADSRAASWGDYNNDGLIDLFIANLGVTNFLYKNEGGGNFSSVTDAAISAETGNSIGAVWADFDNNGNIDLFVANGGGENNFLFMNNGDGSFSKVAEQNIVSDGGDSRGCAAADYNNDGFQDLFVANGSSGGENNFLYLNDRSGSFIKVTSGPVVTDRDESSGGSWGDYNNDGWLDLYVTNSGDNANRLYQNDGTGHFNAVAASQVPGNLSNSSKGSAWADFDNDGWLDLYVSTEGEQENMFFRNNGDGTFLREIFGPLSQDLNRDTRGAAWADFDSDGDPDLFVANQGSANGFYRNNLPGSNWLRIRLEGTLSNRSAIGATVVVKTRLSKEDNRYLVQRRTVEGQSGFMGQNSQTLLFGLRQETMVDSITVYWPNGYINKHDSKPANQTLTLTEFNPSETPPQVILNTPQDQSTGITLPPELVWNAASGATRYHLQVATDISFSSPLVDESSITNTVFTVAGAAYNQVYYWQVRAGNADQWGPWSAVWKFTTGTGTGTLPAAPVLKSPVNGAINVTIPPTISWNAVSGAQKYWFQLSESGTFDTFMAQDSNTTFTTYTTGGGSYNTVYYWRVCAKNETGWGPWSAPVWNFTTEGLSGQPDPPSLLNPADTAQDQPIPVFLRWDSNVSGAEYEVEVSLNSTLGNPVFHEQTTNKYIFVRSIDYNTTYYWRVRVYANSLFSDWSEVRTFKTQAASVQVVQTLSFPSYERRDEFKSSDYQMIGLPGEANIDFSDVLGGSAEVDWMAYWDNGNTGSASEYLVPFDGGSGVFKFKAGRAFWFIHNGSLNINRTVPSVVLNDMAQAGIEIHPDWNLITCPFKHSVDWSIIKAANDITVVNPLIYYNPVSKGYESSTKLEPFKGYYFYNGDAARTELVVPYLGIAAKIPAQNDLSWKVSLELSCAEMVDALAEIGVASDAERGFDRFEFRKPRSFADLPMVYFERPEWDARYPVFANDIRPEFEKMESWAFKVYGPKNQAAKFSLIGLEQIPAEFQVFLIDRTHQRYQDMRENSIYVFNAIPQTCDFELLVGAADAISEKVRSILPADFALGQNYPNPFNPVTTIPLSLPEAGEISLRIFNVLGQEVAVVFKGQLNAGRHYLVWNGMSRAGQRMPSGVYIYQMITETGRRLTGKMVMIK